MSFDTDDIDVRNAFRSILVPSSDVLFGTLAAAAAVVVGVTTAGIPRTVLGLLLVFFLQGYAVVAALFPADPGDRWVIRRLALPFGVSLALLPLLGLSFSALGVGFSAVSVLGTTALITVVGLLVAGRRRVHLSGTQRGHSRVGEWVGRTDRALLDRPTTELLVNTLTLVAVVTAMAGLVFAVVAPAPSPQYAQFSVLTENESGELVADDYPTNFTAGEGQNVVLEIANEGPEGQTYTVLAQLQRYDRSSDSVTARSRLLRLDQTVAAGETWNRSVTLTPDMTGQQMRLVFLLYPDDPPANPTVESAQEHLFIWVNVSGSGPTASSGSTLTPSQATPTSTAPTPNGSSNTATANANTSTPIALPSPEQTPEATNETPTSVT